LSFSSFLEPQLNITLRRENKPDMIPERSEPIAVVGIGCRFPGEASSATKLWDLLQDPRDVSQEIPPGRFNLSRLYHLDGSHHGTTNVKRSYLLSEDIRCFDTQFFGIPPTEAEPMDPQHRILLEVVFESLSAAGLTIEQLHNSDTAVYVGLMCSDYYVLQAQDINAVPTYNATGIANSNASSRISYFFNWHGPSMTIDTACSSSLVAVHEAVQALRSGTSRVAVAAGTNLLLSPLPYVSESKLNMLSPTGRSRMWDADADGYARGEGVAAVILKTLSSALQDGDQIECIIRETGVNQDGRTKGITMPSALAQASLIQDTYARAGLDPADQQDRCQYFEAHGTGTPAGDPQEAEALSRAFFPSTRPDSDFLHVGSVKTVIGHTEGTAGMAGLIKACMALKHALIPPNLLFNQLNPELKPFTRHLRVSTALQTWPDVPEGHPRRASVNSFGFGGTNAHAILESYEEVDFSSPPLNTSIASSNCKAPVILPFLFSGSSEKSLIAMLQQYLSYLYVNESISLQDLAHTLATKRSCLPVRVAFTATAHDQLCARIQTYIQEASEENGGFLENQFSLAAPAILGIFTGQGAQWAAMGSMLVRSCEKAREIIEDLDRSLVALPEHFVPRWSLTRELLAGSSTSRITEAEISQPLCTAIQIVLIDLIRAAGFEFTAIVGHSSGEIAAAYAAGFISSFDAIRIAFFRGLFARLAGGENGESGAMMAVGTSVADARELCGLEEFQGRLWVAAHNSDDSVTLSGDVDAIENAKRVFDEENKFARILKVDTAYHSHHMNTCAEKYIMALRKCDIQVLSPGQTAPKWFSSVRIGVMNAVDELKAQYWVDNMTQAVLFKPALEKCIEHFPNPEINFVLEVGPHPALKGPAMEVMRSIGCVPPYSGTLQRGADDIEAFASAIGSLWTVFGNHASNFRQFEQVCGDCGVSSRFLRDLPQYPWNHDRILWAESRRTKLFYKQEGGFHDLLGVRDSDGTDQVWRWQNILKVKELPWLLGHALQGQTVFPGTGYIALAVEAAWQIAGGRPVQMIELLDLKIPKAIAINDSIGTELTVSITDIATSTMDSQEIITANFATFSATGKDAGSMALNTHARVRITIGDLATDIFPPRKLAVPNLTPVDIDRFYSAMRDDLGYMYEGPFRGLTSLNRRLGHSSGTIANPTVEAGASPLLFHPGMLDNALQGLFAAYSAPGDGRLWSMRAPTACRRVTLIPQLCGRHMTPEVAFDCTVTDPRDDFITGDVDVYLAHYSHKIIEFEGISFSPFAAATEKDDRFLFQESVDFVDRADGALVLGERRPTQLEGQKALDAERAAFYYLNKLYSSVHSTVRSCLPWYRQALLDNAERVVNLVHQGQHPYAPPHWLDDTAEEIYAMMER
jgi:acyl transferase domain-containing protein